VELRHQLDQMRAGWDSLAGKPRVTAEDVAEVVAMWTGVPVKRIAGEESERCCRWSKRCTSGWSARKRPSRPSARLCAARAPG
jgi:ATP-dependent Clp protease ATP-binding subunit ClpA